MLSIGFGTLVILCAFASSVSSQYGKPERPRPLAVLAPAFNISGLGPDDWAPLADRLGVSHEQGGFVVKPLFFYNQSTYPNELLVHVHIPKTGGTTLFKLFSSRNCGYSTYKLRYRSYRILRRIEKDRRKSSHESSPSACGYFSHEFPSYHDAKLFLTPPIDVYNTTTELVPPPDRSKFAVASSTGSAVHYRLRDMTMLRDPISHVLSAFGHFQRLNLENCTTIKDVVDNRCKLFQFGDMTNKQTSVLGGGNLTTAKKSLNSMFWIGLTELYDASVCLLSFQLGQYNENTCSCTIRRNRNTHQVAPTKNAARQKMKLTADESDRVAEITRLDKELYNYGVELFVSRVVDAQRILGRAIICDGIDTIPRLSWQ